MSESSCERASKEQTNTHMGETHLAIDINELVTEIKSSSEKQVLYENTMKCSECDFECVSRDVLSNHLAIHKIFPCDKSDYKNNLANPCLL